MILSVTAPRFTSHFSFQTFFSFISNYFGITVQTSQKPVFLLNAMLMIPNVVVRPSLDEVQEALIVAGKNITGVSKGVGQWTGGQNQQVKIGKIIK